MWQSIANIVQSGLAFLQNGKAPPNTSSALKQLMEDENHLASKKFFIILSALLVLAFMYYTSVAILCWVVPHSPEVVTAYVTIFSKIMEVLGLIISVYIGAQGLVDLNYNSASSAAIQGTAEIMEENKRIDIAQQILTNNTKEDDYNISEVDI